MIFNGAGIFIIENYNNKPVITLFGNRNRTYGEPGGMIDKGEEHITTAVRETKEETANLINFTEKFIMDKGIPIISNTYICYVVYIQGLSKKDHRHNIDHILNSPIKRMWKEMTSMTRIDLEEFKKNYESGKVTDIYGRQINLHRRVIELSRKILPITHKILEYKPYRLNRVINKTHDNPHLISTISYR